MDKKELLNLLEQYKSDSKNLDLINKIAIGYSQNSEICQNNEDYIFFEKAYNLKTTIKTTNNFANHLFYECYEHEKALQIQKECIALNPKGYLPYLFYATTLIEVKKYEEAIISLEISQSKNDTWDAEYNLGYCKYMIGDYKSAEKYFLKTSQDKGRDIELKSMFGLALVYYRLGNKGKSYKVLDQMQNSEHFDNAMNDYDIGILYFFYDDYENAKNNTLKCGINGIDLLDWKELGYSVYVTDKDLFHKENNIKINELKENIQNIKDNTDNWKYMSDEEKQEYISDFLKEIKDKENVDQLFEVKPKLNIDKYLVAEYYGCSIFGCYMHGNPEND